MDKHFGLETFLRVEKADGNCAANDTTIILVHWCLANQGILCIGAGEQIPDGAKRSEKLPEGWNIGAGAVYSLVYRDRGDTEYLVKAVAADSVLIISMMNFKTEKSADVSLKPSDIVKASDGAEAELSDVDAVVSKIQKELIDKVTGKKKDTAGPSSSSDSKNKEDEKKKQTGEDPLLIGRRHPRDVDPGMPDFGGIGPRIGGADLDPFGGGSFMGGGGMIMDPTRGGGGRGMDPRWDPVGPGAPGLGGRGGFGGGVGPLGPGRGGRRNFGDGMRPPDFNDDYNNMFM